MNAVMMFLFGLLFAGTAFSQDKPPEPFEVTADTATYIRIPADKVQYFVEDEGHALTLHEVLKPGVRALFKPLGQQGQVVIPVGTNVWMRYRIRNAINRPLDITIPQGISRADIYVSGPSGTWKRYITGYEVPHSQRDGYKRIRQARHTIPAGAEIVVYERDVNGTVMHLSVAIGIDRNVVKTEYIENDSYLVGLMWSCVLFGLFIFGAIFNFFFYYTVREKVYLLYGILLVFVAVSYVSVPLSTVLLKEFPGYRVYDSFIGFSVTFFLFSVVSLMFLQAAKYHRKGYKVLLGFSTLFLVLSFLRGFFAIGSSQAFLVLIHSLRYLMIAGILVIMVADLLKKRYFARMYMLANMPFMIIFTAQLVTSFDYLSLLGDIAVIWAVIVLSWSLFARYKYLQAENARHAVEKEQERNALIAKQNEMLEQQVAKRTSELTQSLADLKQTQNQLIQSEKMASLGELTAGIAHEIQNPLNFVNNFSEVSIELLDELKEELEKGDTGEAIAIAGDVAQNLEKIHHHGRRADGIVKGMLQHSRTSSGQKEPTDINALADEYLRLAYHGLRAKDKSFNAELITHFYKDLPKAIVIPQDIGRVLLNLFTNAFYATQQKSKQSQSQLAGEEYKPKVTVTTKQSGNSIEITVKDNGTGIPDTIKDKIVQPFFTTKPTGEGTGLGLSLSYDIIVKGHGGSIAIDSKESIFTAFTITLPV